MVNDLLLKARKLSGILKNCTSEKVIFEEILEEIRKESNSNIILVDKDGMVLLEKLTDNKSIFHKNELDKNEFIEPLLNDQFNNIVETKDNIFLDTLYIKNISQDELLNYKCIISPLNVISERIGTIVFYKENEEFSSDTIVLIEYVSSVLGLVILNMKSQLDAEEVRRMSVVKSAIATLSYSELEAILHIFDELDGNEGLLVASKIADKVGITRSVIVNALRKFESAGVIESRSLGMKGTFIKVLNDYLIIELDKLRK